MRSVPFICGDSPSKNGNNSRPAAVRLSKAIVMHRRNSRVCAVANSSLHCSGYNQPQANNDCNNDTCFRHRPEIFYGTCRSLERTGALDPVSLPAAGTFWSVEVVVHTRSLTCKTAHEVLSRAPNILITAIQVFLALNTECSPGHCD
jgi:hypothetical protein